MLKKINVDIMGYGNNAKNLVTFLYIANYIFLMLYLASIFGIHFFFTTNRRKYFRILSTIYTLCMGFLLISLRFDFLFDLRKKSCFKEIKFLMLTAGLIILSTISKEDLDEVWDLLVPDTRLAAISSDELARCDEQGRAAR